MSRAANILLGGLLAAAGLAGASLSAASSPDAVAGEVIVAFKPAVTAAAARSCCAGHALQHVRNFPHLSSQRHVCHVRSATESTAQIIARLQADPNVEFAEPNYRRTLTAMPKPNDTQFAKQWPLHNIGQTVNGYPGTPGVDIGFLTAWGMAKPDAGEIVVAVLDSGIDLTHPDLTANLWTNPAEVPGDGIDNDGNGYVDDSHGYDFADGDPDPADSEPTAPNDLLHHGTHTSGTIAAVTNNGRGIAGTAFSARLLPLKITHADLSISVDAILAGMNYAVMMKYRGVNIVAINASYGGSEESLGERDAIQAAGNAGIVFCAAAGNTTSDNTAVPFYPANLRLSNMIVVAASDADDSLAWFSNYGTKVDLAAPGRNIYSTKPATSVACGYSHYPGTELLYTATTPGLGGTLYDCGYGATAADFPPAVNGNIALIQRGAGVNFATKVTNAIAAGATAAIIFNNIADPPASPPSLGSGGSWIPSVFITQADGQALLATTPTAVTVAAVTDPYFFSDGTSAAAPFVSAAVAFAARNFPLETAAQRVARILNGVTPVGTLTGKVLTGGRLNLAGIVDPGANAIPDWWETQYFGTIGINPAADPDGDRFSNLQEYLIGTQPNNSASKLAIASVAIVPNGAARDFRITFPTATGVTYRVEFSDTLAAPWTALGSDVTGTGAAATVSDPNAVKLHPRRFYRVRIISP